MCSPPLFANDVTGDPIVGVFHDYKNVRCVAGPDGACSRERGLQRFPRPPQGSVHQRGGSVYTIIDRRTTNIDRLPETGDRAERDYFPKLQAEPGFAGFHLIADERSGLYVGVTMWEDKSHADAFEATM